MKRRIVFVMLVVLALVLTACGGQDAKSSGEVQAPANISETAGSGGGGNAAPEVAFEWKDNLIMGIADGYKLDKVLVIPARAEGFEGPFLKGDTQVEEVRFESDKDVKLDFAFSSTTALKRVVLPKELKSVGQFAFSMAEGLESIVIPGSVETIAYQAFIHNDNLKSVVIEEGVKRIEDNAFRFAAKLEELKLADSIEHIGDSAFDRVNSLKSFTLPKNLKTMGDTIVTGDVLEDIFVPEEVELQEGSSPINGGIGVKVHVKAGSYMDENYDKFFTVQNKVVD